jgi:protein-S-isoprenylcysteine O-methyltransferase Ste14
MDREALRTLIFRHREALLVLLSVPVIAAAMRGGGLVPIDALLGICLTAAGVLLRLYAARRIGRGARVFRAHASAGLVSSGPYRWSRNPLYLAAALMLCGLGLVAGGGWIAVALLPATLVAYTPVLLIEERALFALLGDAYRRYVADVPRWIGFAHAPLRAPDQAPVAWREVLRREKGLVPWTLCALLAIAAVRSEWIPLASLAQRVEIASGRDLTVLVAGATGIGAIVNATKVELHRRRRERRHGRSAAPPVPHRSTSTWNAR